MPDEFELRFADSEFAPTKPGETDSARKAGVVDDPDAELNLAPPEGKSAAHGRAEIEAQLRAERPEPEDEPVEGMTTQFSLMELMQIVFCCAVGFAVMRMVPTDLYAGVLGFATIGGLALLTILKPQQMIFYLAWWTLLGVYAITAVIAVISTKA